MKFIILLSQFVGLYTLISQKTNFDVSKNNKINNNKNIQHIDELVENGYEFISNRQLHTKIDDYETIRKIAYYMKIMDIVNQLESKQTSIPTKLDILEQHNMENEKSKYTYDLFAGGLYDDWNNIDFEW